MPMSFPARSEHAVGAYRLMTLRDRLPPPINMPGMVDR